MEWLWTGSFLSSAPVCHSFSDSQYPTKSHVSRNFWDKLALHSEYLMNLTKWIVVHSAAIYWTRLEIAAEILVEHKSKGTGFVLLKTRTHIWVSKCLYQNSKINGTDFPSPSVPCCRMNSASMITHYDKYRILQGSWFLKFSSVTGSEFRPFSSENWIIKETFSYYCSVLRRFPNPCKMHIRTLHSFWYNIFHHQTFA